ncbi:MAG: uncharacterized protein KVP18_003244 [Porospora cf. gigantea A]|nr:MAG: hypothetical protein KVP18_003244 [Porospora cf. gigantea A]
MMVIDHGAPPHNCPLRQAPLDFFHSLGSILWCKRQVPTVPEPCQAIDVPSCPLSGFPLYAPRPSYWSPLTGRLLLASLKDRRKRQPPPLPRRSKRLSFSNDYLDRLDSYFDDFDELGDLCTGAQSTQQSLDDYLAELDDFDFDQRPDDDQWALFPSVQVHPASDLQLKPTAEFAQLPFHLMFPKSRRPSVKSAVEQTFMRLARSHGDVLGVLVANYLSFVGDIADAAVVADTVAFLDQVQTGSRGVRVMEQSHSRVPLRATP